MSRGIIKALNEVDPELFERLNDEITQNSIYQYLKPIADQHRQALEVKNKVPVIVCLGNPPYDRTEDPDAKKRAKVGKWVRWGDDGRGTAAILKDFLEFYG